MRKSWMFLTVLGALLIGALTPAVLADSHVDAVFCGELSEADCELLQNATDAANAQPYGAADFELDLLLSEFDGDEESEFWNLTISGSGAYAFAPALMEQMLAIEADPTMLTGEGLVSLLDNLVTGFSGDLELSIFLPLDMMAEITEPDENGDFSDIPLNLRVVDGIAYLDTSVLAMLMSDGSGAGAMPMMGLGDMDSQPGWIGVDLGDLLEMSAADLTDMEMMPESDELDMLSERELLEQYATIERVGDSESSDGQTLAVFETVVDLNALLQDPAMLELMESQMNSARASAMANMRREASVMSADEANEAGPMMQDMMDDFSIELPTSIELSTYESVGLEDGLLHGMEALLLVEMPSPPVMGENDEPGSFELRLYFGAGLPRSRRGARNRCARGRLHHPASGPGHG